MTEMLLLAKDKVMYVLYACLIAFAVIVAAIAIWNLMIYFITQNRISSAKRLYNAIPLGEPKDDAILRFRDFTGSKDQYMEEALLEDGKREEMICLQLGLGRGELGEIRLTYVDDRLVRKQQYGIW